ncbi:MAG: rod shape-determining protein [Clostridia bacterium]|nr:rod shape-determining protein [Clostridia bacterium]
MIGINIGIDLGTTSVIAYIDGKGIVLSEPSVAAYSTNNGNMIAVGERARRMIGREPPSIVTVRPLKDGIISNAYVTEQMLRFFIKKICGNKILKPNVIVSVPAFVTALEKRTILDVITSCGVAKACIIEEPLAAAIGSGEAISIPSGVFVVDIGGGTTDSAIITMNCVSVSSSIKIAGNEMTKDIINYIRKEKKIIIGEITAENIKKSIGSAIKRPEELAVFVKGKDYVTKMPVSFEITSTEIYEALKSNVDKICEDIKSVFEKTPPELVSDAGEKGIILTGGGSLLYGMDKAIESATGVKVKVAKDPLNCVIRGIGKIIADEGFLFENGYFFKTKDDFIDYLEEDIQ